MALRSNVPQVKGLAILIFINGIRSSSSSLDVLISQPLIDFKLNQINVTVSTLTPQTIEILFFNYLIIDISKISNQYSYSFTALPAQSDFSISGIISIISSNSSLQFAFVNFNKTNKFSCSGFICDSCQSIQTCEKLNGYIFNNKCVKCSPTEIFSSSDGCTCKKGFFLINKICGTCP